MTFLGAQFGRKPGPSTSLGPILCIILMTLASPGAAIDTAASSTVRGFYDALLNVMRNGQALGARGRYAQLEPAVARTFDIPFMTRLTVGQVWSGISESQRQRVAQAFGRYVAAIYAERFQTYLGQRMEVLGEQPSTSGQLVASRIIKADGQPVSISYLLRQNQGAWRVIDVYFEGTISEVSTRRSEFAAVLRASGIEGLIEMLNRKADSLAAS